MTIRLGNHANAAFYFQGVRVVASQRIEGPTVEERVFGTPRQVERNVAMEFEVPEVPADLRGWRSELKPCDGLGDTFIPPEFDLGDTKWDQELTREHKRFVEKRCKQDCPFLALCSRDALSAAQDFARFQGVAARLHGTWAGVTFTGREGAPQYRNKLTRIADQMNSGEITWEPSSSFPTTQQTSNESQR
ncbi:WhiB family transcription factor [Gordonia phage Bonum]|nr:WhiB family transcription factor [Gordonia phage Bonum]